ncbi:ribosome maturation factor RimM [soil metagenome]
MTATPEYLIVGVILKPHGIRGELAVGLETDRPDEVYHAGRVLRTGDPAGQPDGGQVTVERTRPFKEGLLLRTVEHTSRTGAVDALRGRTLLLPREDASPLDADEVWTHELVGMRVVADGTEVGTVREVYDTPAGGHLLSIARPDRSELLIPFVRDLVRNVDRDARVLEIEPREGLLEL